MRRQKRLAIEELQLQWRITAMLARKFRKAKAQIVHNIVDNMFGDGPSDLQGLGPLL